MMLLQAGQFGLTRNVFNPGLPPSVVAGGTLWFDASDINTLYTTWPSGGGSLIATDGQGIGAAINKVNAANGLLGGGVKPVYEQTAVNGLSSAVFLDLMGTATAFSTARPSGPLASSSFVTTTAKNIVIAVKVNSADVDTGVAYTNRAIVAEGSGYFGLHVTDQGGGVNLTARAFNFSGGAQQEATITFAKSTWVVLTFSHQSSTVRVRVNGGAWASTASGATDDIGQPLILGSSAYNPVSDLEVVHMMVMNTTQTDASLGFCEQWIATELGLTPWW